MNDSLALSNHFNRGLARSALGAALLCVLASGCNGTDPDPGSTTTMAGGTGTASAGAAQAGTGTSAGSAMGGAGGGNVGQGGSAGGNAGGVGATAQAGSAGSPTNGGAGAAAVGGSAGSSGSGGQAGAASDSWDSYAKGFMTTYCVSCHDDDKQGSATRDYHMLGAVKAESSEIACGLTKSMVDWTARGCSGFPPARQFPVGNGAKPSDAERDRLIQWIDGGTQ